MWACRSSSICQLDNKVCTGAQSRGLLYGLISLSTTIALALCYGNVSVSKSSASLSMVENTVTIAAPSNMIWFHCGLLYLDISRVCTKRGCKGIDACA